MGFIYLFYGYTGLGLLVATWFCFFRIHKVDQGAAVSAPWGFRLLIFPGCLLLWPVVLGKALRPAPAQSHSPSKH